MTAGDVKSALLIEEHKRANPALLHAPPQLSMFETLWPSYDREALSFSILAVLCSVTSSVLFSHFIPLPLSSSSFTSV